MKDVLAAAAELQSFCESRGWKFCVIGGIAVQRWGEPRFTHDADVTLLTGFAEEEVFVDTLLAHFEARLPDERTAALRNRVLRLLASNGVPLDIALGALPFEERTIDRATRWRGSSGVALVTCSAEDLIVHKAFAARERDWIDVQGILKRRGRKLDVEQIWGELTPLVELKEEPAILQKLQRIFDQHLD
ncbi:hypothetical protein BH20VER1_BH20VER1_10780 [soil metagenome]